MVEAAFTTLLKFCGFPVNGIHSFHRLHIIYLSQGH